MIHIGPRNENVGALDTLPSTATLRRCRTKKSELIQEQLAGDVKTASTENSLISITFDIWIDMNLKRQSDNCQLRSA